MVELGWKSVAVLELTALPSIDKESVGSTGARRRRPPGLGRRRGYLAHWMHQCGLADMLASLSDTVWIGMSAGSMVMTPRIGQEFVGWKAPGGSDTTLGVVDLSIFPHLDHPDIPTNTMDTAARWAACLDGPAYTIDDGPRSPLSTERWRSSLKDTGSGSTPDGVYPPGPSGYGSVVTGRFDMVGGSTVRVSVAGVTRLSTVESSGTRPSLPHAAAPSVSTTSAPV